MLKIIYKYFISSYLARVFGILCLISNAVVVSKDGSTVYLTPYIELGNIEDGQKAATVRPFLPGVISYSGLLTVDKRYNSNLFFWFFPKQGDDWRTAPLVLWLQGGPGAPSSQGLFNENGPYVFTDRKLKRRYHSWTKHFNVLYVDNPVGVGFSFTDSVEGYATDQIQVAENLREAIRQFLLLFPALQKNKIIFSGQSYAGKYVTALAHVIHTKNVIPAIDIFGLFIGNPFLSPEHMLHYNEYLYSHGLLDTEGMLKMKEREETIGSLIKSQNWTQASDLFAATFFEGVSTETLFSQLTGFHQHYHLMKDEGADKTFVRFLNDSTIKSVLHVSASNFSISNVAHAYLRDDIMKSVKPWLEELLEHYRVLVYVGQLDIICPYYLQEMLFRELSWSGAWDYYNARRQIFKWNQHLAGYYKTARKFTEVLIRNAGHSAAADQSQWVFGLLRKFANRNFDSQT